MYPNHMTEKSEKEVDFQRISTTNTVVEVKRGRGRPKGAKNKPKVSPEGELVKLKPREEEVIPKEVKRRGRPRKIVPMAATVQKPVATEATSLDHHPLVLAARWIEKNMHPTEMQYYRTRANRNGTSLVHTMVGDLLGFFNVQNADICKQIKKNNFIDKVCNS
jgi:hypothetical protein